MPAKRILITYLVAYILSACTGNAAPTPAVDDNGKETEASSEPTQIPELNFTPVVIEAISPPAFTLHSESPVLERGRTWDSTFVGPGAVVFHDGLFHMFYSGFMGVEGQLPTETVGYAVSLDGYVWQRALEDPVSLSGEPVYSITSLNVSSVLVEPNGVWVMYFTVWLEGSLFRSGIGRATALDPTGPWTIHESLVLRTENPERWDGSRIFFPKVFRTETGYVMYYTGVDVNPRTPVFQIGMATSPDGITWTKYDDPDTTGRLYEESDPVFGAGEDDTWDANGIFNSQVLRTTENWVMLYQATQGETFDRTTQVGFAASVDGIHWERYADNPLFLPEEIMPDFHFGSMLWFYHDNTHFLYFDAFNEALGTAEIYLATSQ